MSRVMGILWNALLYGSVATVLAIAALAGYLAFTTGFTRDSALQALAALRGVNLREVQTKTEKAKSDEEDIAYEDVLRQRAMMSLDRDLREQSIEQGLAELRRLQKDLAEDRRRYDLVRQSFNEELKRLQSVAKNNAIVELQQTLESLKPKQAKDHLVRMLPNNFGKTPLDAMPTDDRKTVIDVVTLMKATPLDKRKKILAEFRSEDEAELLAELLRLIRLGVPEVGLIGDTRDKVQEFGSASQDSGGIP